jgi:hypothetical protein
MMCGIAILHRGEIPWNNARNSRCHAGVIYSREARMKRNRANAAAPIAALRAAIEPPEI